MKEGRLTEKDGLGLLDGLAESAEGQVGEAAVELLGRVEEVHEQRRLERATAEEIVFESVSVSVSVSAR